MDIEERIEGRKNGKSLGLSEFSIIWKYGANIHLFLRTFSLCKNTKYAQNQLLKELKLLNETSKIISVGYWLFKLMCFKSRSDRVTYLTIVSRVHSRRQWHPTPVLLPGKSHGQRSLVGCSPWGCWELDTTQWLHFHFSLSCIGEENGNPLQCSCLENPRDSRAWSAAVYGVAQSGTRWKRLSSSRVHVPGTFLSGEHKEVRRTWSLHLEVYERDRWEIGNWEMSVKSTRYIGRSGRHSDLKST